MCFIYTHISVTKHSCPCRGKFEINAYGKKSQPLRRKTGKSTKLGRCSLESLKRLEVNYEYDANTSNE